MKIMYKRILAIVLLILQGVGYGNMFANEQPSILSLLCFVLSAFCIGFIVETDTYK